MVDLHRPIRKWEIYYADLNPTKGSEQRGIRPVLVLSCNEANAALPVCTIASFSSYKPNTKLYPSEIFIEKEITHLPKDSILMLQQIRTISKERLQDATVGLITNPSTKMEINDKLMEYFNLQNN